MALGKTVKTLREQRGWTLKELSKRSGVPIGTIGALEVRDSVRSEYAAKLAHGFGLPLEDLLPNDQMSPPYPAASVVHMVQEPVALYASSHGNRLQEAIDLEASLNIIGHSVNDIDPIFRGTAVDAVVKFTKGAASARETAIVINACFTASASLSKTENAEDEPAAAETWPDRRSDNHHSK